MIIPRGRGVDAARPVRDVAVHVAAQLPAREEDDLGPRRG